MKTLSRTLKLLFITFLMLFSISASVSAATPDPVTNLKVVASGTTAKLTWKKAKNAKSYYVCLVNNKTGAVSKTVKKVSSNGTTVKKLKEGTTYTFKVRAISKSKTYGEFSDAVSVTIPIKKLTTPKNFALSSTGANSAVLKWSKVSGADGYILYVYNEETKEYDQVKRYGKSTKSDTIGGLKSGGTYKYILKSYKKVNGTEFVSTPTSPVTVSISINSADIKKVRNPRYTVKTKTKLTVKNSKGQTVTIPSGTKLTTSAKKGKIVKIFLADGTTAKVSRSSLKYTGLDSSAKNDYSKATKEAFINAKNIGSNTGWLIWVSEYKFKINVFKGSRGKWKLQREFGCVIGKWSTRTAGGMRTILQKVAHGSYGGPVMHFSPGKGSHANPTGCAFHHYVDGARNKAASHGCIRTSKTALWYIYNNCARGTRVFIY